jgi:hypothetical protein
MAASPRSLPPRAAPSISGPLVLRISPFTLDRIASVQTLFIRALENHELEKISCTESCRAIFNRLLLMDGAPEGVCSAITGKACQLYRQEGRKQ